MKKAILFPALALLWLGILYWPWNGLPPLYKFFIYSSSPLKIDQSFDFNANYKSTPYGEATIAIDTLGIPFIFSDNLNAAAFATGFIHARDRLFQMEMIKRQVSGELSAVVGKPALESDLFWRKFRFKTKALTWYQHLKTISPQLHKRFQAYADGVNAYIQSMPYGQMPIEFHLLGFKPQLFAPENMYLLVRAMDHRLNYSEDDLKYSEVASMLPDSLLKLYYPLINPDSWPIYPDLPKIDMGPLTAESHSSTKAYRFPEAKVTPPELLGIGSNNWAVAPQRTKSKTPILCNDTHLGLTLPSNWYEIHIQIKNKFIRGFSIPGAPFVITGFSNHLAWGMTNATWNLVDFYDLNLNANDLAQGNLDYTLDDKKYSLVPFQETITVKGEKDTVVTFYNSIFGPVALFNGKPLATNWLAMEESHDGLAFAGLEQALTVDEAKNALNFFAQPPQNFVLADDAGNIGMVTAGYAAIHPGPSVGIIQPKSMADKVKYTPLNRVLNEVNPQRGWVHSANQHHTLQPVSALWATRYEASARGRRIAEVLNAQSNHDEQAMHLLQTDVKDKEWDLLKNKLFEFVKPASALLADFDGKMVKNAWQPTVFYAFKLALYKAAAQAIHPNLNAFPQDERLLNLLVQRQNLPTSSGHVACKDLFNNAWKLTQDTLTKTFNTSNPKRWKYENFHKTAVLHLTKIPALSLPEMGTPGNNRTVNVASGFPATSGPSMRTIITLKKGAPQAKLLLSGGQSGRPNSKHYSDQVAVFLAGKYHDFKPVSQPTDLKFNTLIKFSK